LGGRRMNSKEIDEVYFRIQHADHKSFPLHLEIHSIRLLADLPEPLPAVEQPYVDSLGQWNSRNWPGKVQRAKDLEEQLSKSIRQWGRRDVPPGRSAYMGYTDLRFDSTGFFHTHHDGTRWWLVDPDGYAYLSNASTGIHPNSNGPIDQASDLFSYLPPDTGYFRQAYGWVRQMRSYSFVSGNLMRLYGAAWKKEWLNITQQLIRGLGFAGSGNWSDAYFYKGSNLPYVYPMRGFPTTAVKLFRDFPDVFDPEYLESCQNYASQLDELKDDPYMVGYFLGNEPHWAFGNFNLAREMMYRNQTSFTRKALMAWLKNEYADNIYHLSASWELELTSFEELESLVFPHEKTVSPGAEKDLRAFSETMVDQYISRICESVKAVDPYHLNLGLRFAWISSPACIQAGKYFDVFSLNGYSIPDPPQTNEIAAALNLPVMIGEFHFGAVDRGLPSTGLKGVASQKNRGIAYQRYVEQGFSRPEMIGIHYFQWNDQPFTGRFDGENYNIGIVDVTNRPYPELARHIRRTNKRLLKVAQGKIRPYFRRARTMPNIYF